jgi:hypothetical protein
MKLTSKYKNAAMSVGKWPAWKNLFAIIPSSVAEKEFRLLSAESLVAR